MSNYTKTVDFAAKDTLPSGDSGKIIKGTEFETEFDNISTAIATKADSAAPPRFQGGTVGGSTSEVCAQTETWLCALQRVTVCGHSGAPSTDPVNWLEV